MYPGPEHLPQSEPPAFMDHLYQFTLTGRCGRDGCGKVERDHPAKLKGGPDPLTECDIDHGTISPKLLMGDDGLQWSRCLRCNVQLEPKFAWGVVTGKPDALGRGQLTFTLKKKLTALRGWFDFNGGDG